MKHALRYATAVFSLCTCAAHADVTLNYEISAPDAEPSNKTISISRFFARIDDPTKPDSYLVYQAGKFFPLYRVEQSAKTYTRLTPEVKPTLHAGVTPQLKTNQPEPADKTKEAGKTGESELNVSSTSTMPSDVPAVPPISEKTTDIAPKALKEKPKTVLRLTKKTKKIAGIACRVVEELAEKQPVMTHCMADKSRLGISERETRSLARIFSMARERGFGWLGTATDDERFVSVASKDLQNGMALQLKSRSTKPLAAGYLRIPSSFKQVQSE